MVDPELDELKREFLTEAEDKVREIRNALGNSPDRGALERVAYIAHQLKGSGGSYGYEKISAEAAEIEKAVEKGNDAPSEKLAPQIQQHVANLQDEIDRRTRELTVNQ